MKFFPIYSLGINPCLLPPCPPRSFGIIGLGGKSRKIFEFKGLIRKIFRNKDLGVSNSTDNVLDSSFIASAPVSRFTPPPLKASAKTKGVAGGHALILCRVVRKFWFAVWRRFNYFPFYFYTVPRAVQ